MDFQLPSDFLDIEEAKPIPGGFYEVRIIGAESGPAKSSGFDQWVIEFDFPEHPDAKRPKNLYLQIPGQEGGADQQKLLLKWKRFFACFNISFSAGDSLTEICQNLPGETAQTQVTLKHDDKFGDQNEIVIPRLV